MARLQWQDLCAALHPTQRRAERIDAHAGFGRQGQRLFEFFLVCLGRVPSPAPRQDMRARRQTGGVSERLVRRAPEQRVGLPFYLGPILPKQRALDRIASKPEVVVAKGAFREQRLSGGQGGVGFKQRSLLPQSKLSVSYRPANVAAHTNFERQQRQLPSGELGAALRRLGFERRRNWRGVGGFRAVWRKGG